LPDDGDQSQFSRQQPGELILIPATFVYFSDTLRKNVRPMHISFPNKGSTMKNRAFRLLLACGIFLFFSHLSLAAEVVLTPFGQSPDAMMVKVVLKKLEVDGRLEKVLQADGLQGEKVLITVVAGSSKGLGAAGIDKDEEIARMQAVAEAARTAGMKILVMHIGGKGRRGKLTDAFIAEAVPMADKLIVVEGGDYDGLFSELAQKTGVDLMPATSIRETSGPLQEVLTKWGILQ
jgi:hypothetical protein